MKKTMLTLIALLVMGFQLAGAQTYEVEYSGKMDSETINKIMSSTLKQPGISADMFDTLQLRKDCEAMVFAMKMTLTDDKMKSELDPSNTHAEIHILGTTIDMADMFLAMGMEGYYDFVTGECYMGVFNPIDGIKYLVAIPEEKCVSFKEVEGSKTILGHECKIMETERITYDLSDFDVPDLKGKTVTSKIKVWYATDIPYEMKGYYTGVPGLVLGYEMEMQGNKVPVFATSIKKTDNEITCPEGKKISFGDYYKIMKKCADDMKK